MTDSQKEWTSLEGYAIGQDEHSSRQEARITAASNGTAEDEHKGVGSGTAYGAADLEDEKCNQKDPFEVKDGIELSKEQLC